MLLSRRGRVDRWWSVHRWRPAIVHGTIIRSRLLADEGDLLALTRLDFLVLLRQVTWRAAAGHQAVGAAIALETVLLTDLASLHHLDDPVETAAAECAVSQALFSRLSVLSSAVDD